MLNFLIILTWMFSCIGIVLVGQLELFGGLSERLGRRIFLVCCVGFLGTGYWMWSEVQQKAIAAGFESSHDQREAKKASFTDPNAWRAEKLKRSSQLAKQ